ncbi:MAG: replicative DNA helicase [Peptoniphilaceae bacterium]|nr:replicative DNA helicase [Peptoniphilaceae bacterium]MDD7383898.1 replicative DNA helicase [Peptoniphilaceae bacterium]MDY3738039.1 replicative DNA helicase [Peptoniphilaceae bacterium]
MGEENFRNPPESFQSEIALLGAIIKNNSLIDQVNEILKVEDFYDSRNQIIYKTFIEMNDKNIKIDNISLANKLKDKNILDEIGGNEYIYELMVSPFYTSNVDEYAKTIREKSLLRKLISAGEDIIEDSFLQKDSIGDIISKAEDKIFNITQQTSSEGLKKISLTMPETLKILNELALNEGEITGITSGLSLLDRKLSGFQGSQLLLLAARPAMGKTAMGLSMAWQAAKNGKKVAIFSLEMSSHQLNQRLLSMVSRVDLSNIITGKIADDEWGLIMNAANEIKNTDIYIDETAGITVSQLRSKAKRMKAEVGLDLIVIDYLQLMSSDSNKENRQQEISTISRGLKNLSKELNTPVLSLAQLSREADKRSDHKPILSDLRESGAIEQDADVVMLLFREDYYDESVNPNIAEIIIAKHRNGETGTIEVYFDKARTTFRDLYDDEKVSDAN